MLPIIPKPAPFKGSGPTGLQVLKQYQVRTIIEYAQYVLDDPRVIAFIEKFMTFQAIGDRMMDAFEGMVDAGLLVFKNDEELRIARSYNTSVHQKAKNDELHRMIQNEIFPPEWRLSKEALTVRNLVKKGADQPHPNFTDIPLIMFYEFAQDRAFGRYLYGETLHFLSGTYFAKDIDLARQRYTVFAIYLWVRMDAKSTFDTKSDTFYEFTQPVETQRRVSFLKEFRNYIHLDLWDSSEYKKKQKDGVIMRLRLATFDTGSIVVQECRETSGTCNKVYTLNKQDDDIAFLQKAYPVSDEGERKGLKKLGLFFQCRHCQKATASFYSPLSKEAHFYCDSACFRSCCDPGK